MKRKKIIPSPANKKAIERALKEHRALKKANEVLKDYKGSSFKILKIKQLVKSKLK